MAFWRDDICLIPEITRNIWEHRGGKEETFETQQVCKMAAWRGMAAVWGRRVI